MEKKEEKSLRCEQEIFWVHPPKSLFCYLDKASKKIVDKVKEITSVLTVKVPNNGRTKILTSTTGSHAVINTCTFVTSEGYMIKVSDFSFEEFWKNSSSNKLSHTDKRLSTELLKPRLFKPRRRKTRSSVEHYVALLASKLFLRIKRSRRHSTSTRSEEALPRRKPLDVPVPFLSHTVKEAERIWIYLRKMQAASQAERIANANDGDTVTLDVESKLMQLDARIMALKNQMNLSNDISTRVAEAIDAVIKNKLRILSLVKY